MAGDGEHELISGGHLGAKAPKAEGVDVIFTLCGGHFIDSYDGCVDEGVVVDVRHEQVAAHAADGYARIAGKPGCAAPGPSFVARKAWLEELRARTAGKPSVINVWVDPNVSTPGTMNQPMYK
jgi:thiamine pyrophosphate-dependent acetolactate synthase large subunit-like protein